MSAVVAGAPSSRASAYADWSKIGEGTFGVVYRAKLAGAPPPFRPASAARGEEEGQSATPKSTAAVAVAGLAIPTREPLQAGTSHVALKRIRANNARAGVDFTAIREIKMLGEMNHPNVIKLWECLRAKAPSCFVLELCVTDVEEIIRDRNIDLTPAHVKSLVAQLLSATQYMHERWVLHRDLKPNNLLVDRRGVLKVTDFGLARTYGGRRRANDTYLGDSLVPPSRAAVRISQLRQRGGRVVSGVHFRRAHTARAVSSWQQRDRPARDHFQGPRQPDEGHLAKRGAPPAVHGL